MRKHLFILAKLLKKKGLRQSDVARILGYKSASAVGMILRGVRPVTQEKLEELCNLAGVTLVNLASMSDDLVLTKTREATQGALLIDEMDEAERQLAVSFLQRMRSPKSDR